MVTADGRDVTVAEPDPDMPLLRSSYGLLGIVYEVTFHVVPRQKVKYRYVSVSFDRWLRQGVPLPPLTGKEILGRADGFLGFLLPYRRQMLVERRTLLERPHVIWGLDRLRLWLRTFAWTTGARPFMGLLRLLPRTLRRRIIDVWVALLDRAFLRLFFLRFIGGFASFRADAMIDFKRPVSSYFDFTFWAFPAAEWDQTVRDFLKFCEEFQQRTGFRPGLPVEVYFIRQDVRGLLSFSHDTDIFTLDLVNWTDTEPACWREMNRAFNGFAARHGGRPLLNQTKELSRSVARHLWTPAWRTLAAARAERDPQGRFLTPFFQTLLP
jgi:FAD/FMN-containing dehydrogenase